MNIDRIRELRADTKESARHAYVRGNVDSGRYWDELDSALAAAEALARLEAWLGADEKRAIVGHTWASGRLVDFSLRGGPAFISALTAALDQVEAKP